MRAFSELSRPLFRGTNEIEQERERTNKKNPRIEGFFIGLEETREEKEKNAVTWRDGDQKGSGLPMPSRNAGIQSPSGIQIRSEMATTLPDSLP